MILNYLRVTWRNMMKSKLFTFINIFGMSVSLACCILLFQYAQNELTFDRHHQADVYRLTSSLAQKDGEMFRIATSSIPIAYTIIDEIPEIKNTARVMSSGVFGGKNSISYEEESWYIENGYISDTSIFNILALDVIQGNKDNPLNHHNAVVLEKSWARTIFGDIDPIGKILKISSNFGTNDFEVSAIYDKSTYRSHFNPNFVVSMANSQWNQFFNQEATNWVGNNMVFTYIQLHEDSDPGKVNDLIHEVFLKYGAEQMQAMGLSKTMALQPVQKIHTDTDFYINIPNTTSLTFIYVLTSIGVIILILACVNYINLSTARAGKRALEVGIRKVLGVSPIKLIYQFLGESAILVFVSILLSVILVQLALPFFNQLINNPIQFNEENLLQLVMYLFGFWIFSGIIAGFYPAFYQSSFKPEVVLKGRGKDRLRNSLLRKSLVVFQFVITICLVSSIIIISRQVDFIQNKELGFNPETKIVIPFNADDTNAQYETLKNLYMGNSNIKRISGASSIPGSPILNDLLIYKDGQTMDDAIHIYNNTVDLEYAELLGIELLSGRFFSDYQRDSTIQQILISKTGAEMLGFAIRSAPGKMVYFDWEGQKLSFEILGVVDDIHQFSLHQAIDPMMYSIGDGQRYGYMLLEADPTDFQRLISELETGWKEQIIGSPFEYFTLSDHLMLQYQADFNTFNLIKYFAVISIVISCLGLYAMSLFTAESRFREIGIRKTFGASSTRILTMVTIDLSLLVVIAFVLSLPITWYGMNQWLETFAYRITPGIITYLLGGLVSIIIAWLTISYQSFRASNTNPVDVLKEE
jgi:putative ABC transport system permease protein